MHKSAKFYTLDSQVDISNLWFEVNHHFDGIKYYDNFKMDFSASLITSSSSFNY